MFGPRHYFEIELNGYVRLRDAQLTEQLSDGGALGDFTSLSVNLDVHPCGSLRGGRSWLVAHESGAELLYVERLKFAVLRLAGSMLR